MYDNQLTEVLHKSGMRITPQRIAICEFLTNTEDHPTAQEIYERLKTQFPSLSLTTVYNTLDMLVGVGLVNALGSIGDDTVHFDGNTKPHINLACQMCHKIFDLESECISDLNSEIVYKSGFDISGSRILYFGVCPDCKSRLQII